MTGPWNLVVKIFKKKGGGNHDFTDVALWVPKFGLGGVLKLRVVCVYRNTGL